MNEPTVAQALAGASKLFTTGECLRVLAREYRKEVARMAAAVEAVKALPRLRPGDWTDAGNAVEVKEDGWLLDRDDVLAALDQSERP